MGDFFLGHHIFPMLLVEVEVSGWLLVSKIEHLFEHVQDDDLADKKHIFGTCFNCLTNKKHMILTHIWDDLTDKI